MTENAEWKKAVQYKEFLTKARENVELIKARYNGLVIGESYHDTIQSIQNDIKILIIGNDRCDDTAGTLPILARICDDSHKLELRILDSDAHARYHQEFKVNGKRKTPVILFLNSNLEELCRWVERPNAVYKLINEKSNPSLEARKNELKKLYSDSEIQQQTLHEFMRLILRADFILGRT
jgi:hypothetical protein